MLALTAGAAADLRAHEQHKAAILRRLRKQKEHIFVQMYTICILLDTRGREPLEVALPRRIVNCN